MNRKLHLLLTLFMSFSLCSFAQNATQKKTYSLEYELEQLHRLDLLPQYRTGVLEQESSYDRTGNNDDGFSGKYSFIRKEDNKLVLADFKGPGVVNRIWTPTPTNDTIQFYIDGEKTPRISIPFIDLFSGKTFPFIKPVVGNEVGGYYCYVPIQFNKSCVIKYVGEKIEFHQIQYRPYPKGTKVEPFTFNWTDAQKAALEEANNYWAKQANPVRDLQKTTRDVKIETKQFFLKPGETVPFYTDEKGGRVVGFEVECGDALLGKYKDIVLQAQWDDDAELAINSPAADYFGYAYGNTAMQSVVAGNAKGINYSYLPMPYSKKAKMQLVYEKRAGVEQPVVDVKTKVYYSPVAQNVKEEGRLYSIWRREINPKNYEPYLMADIEDKGHFVGVIHQAQALQPGMTLFFEGDDSIVVDGRLRMHGTGSEDFYNGGWYALLDRWDRGVSLPIHGSLDYSLPMARTGGYRFCLTDKMSFDKHYLLTMEHGPEQNKFPVDYTTVAFYYGSKPSASAVQHTEKLREVYYPTTHIFFPQLMDLSLGWNTTVQNRGRLVASTEGEGMVRIMLNEVPEGIYKIKLSYYTTPDGGEFALWNRQQMITDWKDVNSKEEVFLEHQELGTINLTRHTNSISIKLKKTDKGATFHFDQLTLEKQ